MAEVHQPPDEFVVVFLAPTRQRCPLSLRGVWIAFGGMGELPDQPEGQRRWSRLVATLEETLQALWDARGAARLAHDPRLPKEPGLYLFLVDGVPVYVGQSRNLRNRLAAHCRPSSRHNSASLAFNLARRELEQQGVELPGTREQVEALPVFQEPFKRAKERVAAMEVRYLRCDDPELRTVFEVFAAERLGTKTYNTFETH